MNIDTIRTEWQSMLCRGIIPCFKYQISEDDWLLVDLEFTNEGLVFSFDSGNNLVAFDGWVTVINDDRYLLPWYFDMPLNRHLEVISDNMIEGYLLVNEIKLNPESEIDLLVYTE